MFDNLPTGKSYVATGMDLSHFKWQNHGDVAAI
jgi:hypothetical protein